MVVPDFAAPHPGYDLRRFESKQARDNHNVGWSSSFDRLTKVDG